MTFLPIVARELQVSARRRSTYRVRSYAGLVVILGGAWLFLVMRRATSVELAQNLFGVLTGCAVFFGLVSGCFATADCLSQEKREGTLGLLFLTDLKGHDVVLGKLVANSLNAFYTMAAVVPLLSVPLILGGLTMGDFVRMALVALDALFFSLAAGVFVSALSRSGAHAAGWTFLIVLFCTALLPIAGAFIAWRTAPGNRVLPFFLFPSAFYTYSLAPYVQYQYWAGRYWASLGVIHGLGWLFLAIASVVMPRVWQDRPADGRRVRWRERWRQWSLGNTAERLAFRRRLLTVNAFLWLASRTRHKALLVWGGLAIIAAGWLWGLAEYHRDWLMEPGYYLFTGFCAHLFLRMRFASEVPWQLAEERKAGTLELLLSTPLRVSEIIAGQRLALQRQFLGPVLVVLGLDIVALLSPYFVHEWGRWEPEGYAAWLATWGGAIVLLALDMWALFWVGLWQGLTAKTALRATSNSFGNLFMIPCVIYAIFLLWLVLGVFSRTAYRPGLQPGPWAYFGAWIIPRLVTDLGVGIYMREKLLTQFRLAAQQQRDPRPGFWGAPLGRLWGNFRRGI